jgi:tetraacyldisaccharide 4'-kinase
MGRPLAASLAAMALGYRGLLALRQVLYDAGCLRSRRLPCPVVSVGNLTLGGTGKTPMVELAARTLQTFGVLPGIVSRGYRRRTRGALVVADRDGTRVEPWAAGDEPYLLARRLPGVPVVVGENRYEAGRLCLERFGIGALVLDDAFQHKSLTKDLEVVTISGAAPWGNGSLFPRGPLREPLAALGRAHLVVIAGPPDKASAAAIADTVRAHSPRSEVVTARYEPVRCWEVWGRAAPRVEDLGGVRVGAFAGIGRPANFERTLAELGLDVVGFAGFPDHHWYDAREVERFAADARARGARALITTEKDAVRCLGLAPAPLPLWALAVRLVLTEGRCLWEGAFRKLTGRHEAA